MRRIILGTVVATGMGLMGLSVVSAGPFTGGVRDATALEGVVEHAQYESRYCRRLRRACEFKDERGQTGEGNCRRYRQECGRRR